MRLFVCALSAILVGAEPDRDGATAADRAVALLALASAREAQLDEADQRYLKRLQHCAEVGDCAQVVEAFKDSKSSFRALEDQALNQAKAALTAQIPPVHPHPLRSHVSKHSKATTQSSQSLHRLVFLAVVISLGAAAFLSGRRHGDHSPTAIFVPVTIPCSSHADPSLSL